MTLAQRIKERREALGLGLRELGRKVGVSATLLSRIESGLELRPSSRVLALLAGALGLDPDDLAFEAGVFPRDLADKILAERRLLRIVRGMVESRRRRAR